MDESSQLAPAGVAGHGRLALALAGVLAALGAWTCFHPEAIGWDPAEYVWVARASLLPHAPYVGYLFLGRLLGVVLPLGLALSLASAAAFVATVLLLPGALRGLSIRADAALYAAVVLAGYPVCMRQAGIQEVYSLQLFLVVLGLRLLAARSPHALPWSGAAFGAATTVHHGTLLVLPAFLLLLVRPERRGGPLRWKRAWSWCGPAAALGALGLLVAWRLFSSVAPPRLEFGSYLHGIELWARTRTPGAFVEALARELATFFSPEVVGLPALAVVLVACGALAALRRPWIELLPWLAYGGGYAAYEALLGRNVDRGLYVAYLALPAAVLSGIGLAALARLVSSPAAAAPPGACAASTRPAGVPAQRLGTVLAWGTLLALAGRGAHVALRAHPTAELAAFDHHPAVVASRWIERHLPPDAVVVEPLGVDNMNLLPSLHLRRPVPWYRGAYRWMEPYERWAPVHPALLEDLSSGHLVRALAEGRLVIALDRALEGFDPRLELLPLRAEHVPAGASPPVGLLQLALRPAPLPER